MKIELREYTLEDAPTLAYLANNINIAKYLRDTFPYPYQESDATVFINYVLSLKSSQGIELAIIVDNHFAGSIGVTFEKDIYRHNAEIGYWLGESFWNQGIMNQVLQMLIPYIFKEFTIHKLVAEVFSNNIASQKVLIKNGFILEATLVEHIYKEKKYQDIKLYSLLNPSC